MKRLSLGFAAVAALAWVGCGPPEEGDTLADQEYADETATSEWEQAGEEAARTRAEATPARGEGIQITFAEVDVDADARVTEEEFQTWWTASNPFAELDVDADAQLNENELGMRFDVSHFETWDADGDGLLVETEVNDGLFALYDENGDGVIEKKEWDRVKK